MKPGDLVRWRGLLPSQYGVVLSVARAGTVTVRTAGLGTAAHVAGDTRTFAKRMRAGYERFLRPVTPAERHRLFVEGWLRADDEGIPDPGTVDWDGGPL